MNNPTTPQQAPVRLCAYGCDNPAAPGDVYCEGCRSHITRQNELPPEAQEPPADPALQEQREREARRTRDALARWRSAMPKRR